MKRRLAVTLTVLLALVASTASAQLLAAKDGPIVYGHHHLNTTNTETARKFWIDALGGVLVKFGTNNTEIIKFPNALLFMREANKPAPYGRQQGYDGRSHRFLRAEPAADVDRVKAGGFRVVTSAEAPPNVKVENDIGIVTGGPGERHRLRDGARRHEGGAARDEGAGGARSPRTTCTSPA
jgi:hypothetical protein